MVACRLSAFIQRAGMWLFADVTAAAKPVASRLPQCTVWKANSCLAPAHVGDRAAINLGDPDASSFIT